MPIDYLVIPSADRFKKDSSVNLAVRSQDQRLHAIDRLLEKMPPPGGDRFAPVVELFMTCNSWIKGYHEKQRGLEKGRYPAVLAVMDAAAKELMLLLDVPSLSLLTLKLSEEFGLKNKSEGNDRHFGATFWDEATRETKRLHIKGGQFYRYMFDVNPPRTGLQPVDSYDFANMMIARPGGAEAMPGFAGFVMSLDREFYMARHWVGGAPGGGGVFHSAYFNGPVAMAGTMLIERGTLKGIRGDSGHYRPGDPAMVHALRALRSRGVNLRGVKVYGYAHKDGDATPIARSFNKAGAMAGKLSGGGGGGGTAYQLVPQRGGEQTEFYSGAVDAGEVADLYQN